MPHRSAVIRRAIMAACIFAVIAGFPSCALVDVGAFYSPPAASKSVYQTTASWSKSVLLAYPAYDEISGEAEQWYADHADMLIISEWQQAQAAAIKGLNRNVLIFLYKTTIDSADETHGAPGYAFVSSTHPEWFLHERDDSSVRVVMGTGKEASMYWMNPGLRGWQEYWTAAAAAAAVKGGWDGVYMDAVMFGIQSYWAPHGILEYAADDAWNGAMEAFLDFARTRLSAAGLLLMGNFTDCTLSPTGWASFLAVSDGGLDEGFANVCQWTAEVWRSAQQWENEVSAMERCAAQGKIFYAIGQNRGVSSTYGRTDTIYNVCTYLLGRDNDRTYFYNNTAVPSYRYNVFRTEYDAFKDIYAINLGKPLGGRYLSQGVWYRVFEKGTVVVNPGPDQMHFFLGDRFTDFQTGQSVSGVLAIAGHAARISLKQGGE